jgi:hypothetical protein
MFKRKKAAHATLDEKSPRDRVNGLASLCPMGLVLLALHWRRRGTGRQVPHDALQATVGSVFGGPSGLLLRRLDEPLLTDVAVPLLQKLLDVTCQPLTGTFLFLAEVAADGYLLHESNGVLTIR